MTDTLFLLAEGGQNPIEGLVSSGFLFPIALILMFYFLIIRPQQKQKKEHEARVEALKKGDKVITNGGIHGVINHKSEKTVSLRIADGVFITIESANISTIVSDETKGADAK